MPRIREVSFATHRRTHIGLAVLVSLTALLLTPTASGAQVSDAAARRACRTTTTVRPCPTTTIVAVAAPADLPPVPTLVVDAVPTADLVSAPADQANAFVFPTFTFPTFTFPTMTFPTMGNFFQNLFTFIQNLLQQTFGRLCDTYGGSFCASP